MIDDGIRFIESAEEYDAVHGGNIVQYYHTEHDMTMEVRFREYSNPDATFEYSE